MSPFGTPDYSRNQKLRVTVLQKPDDIIKALTWLDAMFVVLSGEGFRRLIYLISLTVFHDEREHYSTCTITSANKATRSILRFIKF
jgi:hypothetical protein